MHYFSIIFLIINLAVVYSFGEGNYVKVTDESVFYDIVSYFVQFENGNFGIMLSNRNSKSYYTNANTYVCIYGFDYYLYDNNANNLIDKKEINQNMDLINDGEATCSLYRNKLILGIHKIDDQSFFIITRNSGYDVYNYQKFSITGDYIGDEIYLGEKSYELAPEFQYYSTILDDGGIVSIITELYSGCSTCSDVVIQGLRFYNNGDQYGNLIEKIFEFDNLENFKEKSQTGIDSINNGGFLIRVSLPPSYSVIKVFSDTGLLKNEIKIKENEDFEFRDISTSTFNGGFIVIFGTPSMIELYAYYYDGTEIFNQVIETFPNNNLNIGPRISSIVKKGNTYHLTSNDQTEFYLEYSLLNYFQELGNDEYLIKFTKQENYQIYDWYKKNSIERFSNNITTYTYIDDYIFYSRFDTSNFNNNIKKIVSPTLNTEPNYQSMFTFNPTLSPTKLPTPCPTPSLTLSPSVLNNVGLPDNPNNDPNQEDDNTDPNQEDDNTDDYKKEIIVENKDNSLVTEFIIVTVILCLVVSLFAYIYIKNTTCATKCYEKSIHDDKEYEENKVVETNAYIIPTAPEVPIAIKV